MKIKDGYLLREIAGEAVVLPSGDDLDLSKMISLNDTAKFLWELLEKETEVPDLVNELMKEYVVDAVTAQASVERFVQKLQENGFLM